jgi:hypothetical protein
MALPKFGNKVVTKSRVKITGAGDGLSDALDLEPVAFTHGEHVYFMVRTRVDQVNHVVDKKNPDCLHRVHTMTVEGITQIDAGEAEGVINDALEAIHAEQARIKSDAERAKAKAEGQAELIND